MSSTDTVAKLRAELEGLSGQARMVGLTRLGQALAERYWQLGPGSPAALPELNAAIAAMSEAFGYLDAGDGLRGQVASLLGMLLSARHTTHTQTEQDRETGVRVLEEALGSANLPTVLRAMNRIMLGQLYLGRVTTVFQSPGAAMSLMTGDVSPDLAVNADRAADCFREILDGEPISDELTEVAETMLGLAETLRMMLGGPGGSGRLDLPRLMAALAGMQKLQERMAQGGKPGYGLRGPGSLFSFSDLKGMLAIHPLDRPVTVVHQAESDAELAPSRRPPVAPAPIDRDRLRRSLHDKLSVTGAAGPIWTSTAALLLPARPALPVDVVDQVVALATMIVDAEDADEGSAAVDWFVLAVSLRLRDCLDEGGDHADRLAGAESLLAAVRKVPLDHPAAATMLQALGAFLEEGRPLGGVLDIVADGFAERLDAAISAEVAEGPAELASLHALRCLCRGAGAMAELRRAARALPPDYPWLTPLKAAALTTG